MRLPFFNHAQTRAQVGRVDSAPELESWIIANENNCEEFKCQSKTRTQNKGKQLSPTRSAGRPETLGARF